MVQALPPNGTNHPLDVGPLPRRARRGQHLFYAHVSHLVSEVGAEDGVPVAQQVARQLVEGKGLPQLLSRPLRGRVRGHVAVKNAPTVMGQNQKHVKNLEMEGEHGEEIDGDHPNRDSRGTFGGSGLEPRGPSQAVPVGRAAPSRWPFFGDQRDA